MAEDIEIHVADMSLKLRPRECDTGDYYWHMFWPAARALAEHLVGMSPSVQAKRVLELGAGLGLPGIVAARLGAEVWMNDIDDEALSLTRENAELNDAGDVQYLSFDWAAPPDVPKFDVILGSELVYEPFCIEPLAVTIDRLLAPGGVVLFADPIRSAFTAFLLYMRDRGYEYRQDLVDIDRRGRPYRVGLYSMRRCD